MSNDITTRLEIVKDYVNRGWTPIPLRPNSKAPRDRYWESLTWEGPDDPILEETFTDDVGVGLRFGEASGHLVDVDLDCNEAQLLVHHVGMCPSTKMRSHRGSELVSHLWYVDPEAVYEKLMDPCMPPSNDRAVILEVRADGGHQTAVYPTTHPSGDTYQWLSFEEPGEHPGQVNQDARDLAAVSLLLRYWPVSQGARNDQHLALAGGLLTLGMETGDVNPHWEEFAGHVLLAIALLTGDEDARERPGQCIEPTIRAIEGGRSVRGWTTLAALFEANEKGTGRAVWTAKEWLASRTVEEEKAEEQPETLDDLLDEIDETPPLQWESLEEIIAAGPTEAEELVPGLIYREQVHILLGYGGGGKSMICLWAMKYLMEQNIKSAWLDWQNGPNEAGLRAVSLGLDKKVNLDDWIKYVAFPTVALASQAEAVVSQLEAEGVEVVFLDSFSDALKKQENPDGKGVIEENDNHAVGWFVTEGIDRLRQAGITVVIIDHLSKSDPSRARGAVIKDDLAQVVWSFKVIKKFNARKAGRLRLKSHKTRIGNVPEALVVDITPARDDQPLEIVMEAFWEWDEDDENRLGGMTLKKAPKDFVIGEPVELEDRVVTYLSELEGTEASTREIHANVDGRAPAISEFLQSVREEGHEAIRWVEGTGRKILYYIPVG